MDIKEKKKIPEGRFVAVWIYDNEVWSGTYRKMGNYIEIFNEATDEFEPIGMEYAIPNQSTARYFVRR